MLPICLVPLVFANLLPSHGLQITSSQYLLSFLSKPRPTYLLMIDHCDSFNVLKAFVGLINVDIEKWIYDSMGALKGALESEAA